MTDYRQPELPVSAPAVIDTFRGDFGFLSNFYEAPLWIDGEKYPSVEHAYQAAKASDPETKKLIREARSPAIAKKLGRAVQLPADWDARKVDLMRTFVREKFSNPLLRSLLLATEDATLSHVNHWHDTFWGVYRGAGQDWLGRILMEIRSKLRQE